MFEKDTEWKNFRRLLTDTGLSPEEIQRTTQINRAIVNGYHDQFRGHSLLTTANNTIPPRLLKHAVGFRYLHLNRWANTEQEQRARADYDSGLTELAQGKYKVNGLDAYVLFSIPRRHPVKNRRVYFAAEIWS